MSGKRYSKWVKNNIVKKFFSKFGFTLGIGFAFLLLLSYLAPFVPPDSFWPIAFFGLPFPYLVIINLFFLVIWALQRSIRLLLPLVVLVLGYSNFTNTFQFIPEQSASESQGIKVLSFNVHSYNSKLRSKRTNAPKVIDYFRSTDAEIICLQEAIFPKEGVLSPKSITETLPAIKHYQFASTSRYSGSITYSKYPIINLGEIRFEGTSNLVLFSDIKISDTLTIRVYNCHFQSYLINPAEYSIVDAPGSSSKDQQINEARKISNKLKVGFEMRALQARKVAEHISKSPFPVIVCGDFNDTPVSYAYRTVRGNLFDAFVESGWGISNTYNGALPSLRIDYILYGHQFKAVNYKRDRVYLSDHFPVNCQLIFN